MIAQRAQRVERVAEGPRRDQYDAKVALANRLGDHLADRLEVAVLGRLTDADREPTLRRPGGTGGS